MGTRDERVNELVRADNILRAVIKRLPHDLHNTINESLIDEILDTEFASVVDEHHDMQRRMRKALTQPAAR